jgi:integrase
MVQSDYEPVGFTLAQALSPVELVALAKFKDQTAGRLRLSQLMSIYRANHIEGDDELKMAAADSKMQRLIQIVGDKDLKDLTRDDATKYRDQLLAEGLKTNSVKRNLSAVVAVINKAIIEKQLNIMNPLAKLTIKNLGNDVKEKVPYSLDHLKKLFELTEDPKNRLNTTCIMLQLQASLCCNLKEIALLAVGDINLTAIDKDTGSIHFRPNAFRKSLKTDNRVRLLPLYGRAREAVIRALEMLPEGDRTNPNNPLFPAYAYDARGSDNANATLNKRLRDYFTKLDLPVTNTTSYRHWSITRMRNANVNMDLRHAVSGHSKGGSRIHDSYGEAHGLQLLLDEVIKKIEV